jgi:hypothetical protein
VVIQFVHLPGLGLSFRAAGDRWMPQGRATMSVDNSRQNPDVENSNQWPSREMCGHPISGVTRDLASLQRQRIAEKL